MDRADYADRVHKFMKDTDVLDDAARTELRVLASYSDDNSTPHENATFCLRSACSNSRAEIARTLVDDHGADIQTFYTLNSDRNPGGKVVSNLLDEALLSYWSNADIGKTENGQQRLADTLEFLLQRGVSASANKDAFDGPVRYASLIESPSRGFRENSPEFDWVAAVFGPENAPKPFARPYELIRQYQPEAVKAFEDTLAAMEKKRNEPSSIFGRKARGSDAGKPSSDGGDGGWLRRAAHAIAPKWF